MPTILNGRFSFHNRQIIQDTCGTLGHRCWDCERSLDSVNYYRDNNTSNGYRRYCTECFNDRFSNLFESENNPNLTTAIQNGQKKNTFKLTQGIEKRFGIEIECFYNEETNALRDRSWQTKGDGSIRPPMGHNAIEYVTNIFQGDSGIESLKSFCEKLKDTQHKVNASCGLHIHVDASKLKPYQIINITSFIRVFEPLIWKLMPLSRRKNQYCGKLSYRFVTLKQSRQRESMSFASRVPRYKGFNLQALQAHGTIEFRYHGGTINYEKIYYWLLMCLKIVEYQKEIFWDSEKKMRVNSKKHWELFFSTLQLTPEEKRYWQGRYEELNRPVPVETEELPLTATQVRERQHDRVRPHYRAYLEPRRSVVSENTPIEPPQIRVERIE